MKSRRKIKRSRRKIVKRSKGSKKSYKKRSIKGGKYRFNYNLQLFEKLI